MIGTLLIGNKEPAQAGRDGVKWNTVAGMINAGQSIVMLMIVSRLNGIDAAGDLTFAFAVANLLLAVGKFGIRNFQVTDASNSFTPYEYIYSRVITASLMACIAAGFSAVSFLSGKYAFSKAFVILFLCLIYAVEAVEDSYTGYFQKMGRLDVYGKIFTFRWVVIFLCFAMGDLIFRNVAASLFFALLVSMLLDLWVLRGCFYALHSGAKTFSMQNILRLLRATAPLFGVAFFSLFITNAPKYAIDRYLTAEVQACFGFVSMPVFAIGLLSSFFYQPALAKMAEQWNEKEYRQLVKHIRKQLTAILFIAGFCVFMAWLMGIPVLSILYHADLSGYKLELVIMMLSGCALALVVYFSTILTIMRRQKVLLFGYLAIATLSFPVAFSAVRQWGTLGAAWVSFSLLTILALLFVGLSAVFLYSRMRGKE